MPLLPRFYTTTLLLTGMCTLTPSAHAESERGPFFVEGHIIGATFVFPPEGAVGTSYPLEVAAGYHIGGMHEGFVLGLAQRFNVGFLGASSGATMARVGWDFAVDVAPRELTIAPYLQGGAAYAFGSDASGLVGMGVEGRFFPFGLYEPETGEPKRVRTERVVVQANRIEIKEKIQFRANDAVIESVSFPLLEEIASVIKANPHLRKLRIEGHASAEGDAALNEQLSERRAEEVRKHLVDEGMVDEAILESKGYGASEPIADNETEAGREKNRRVEFTILAQDDTTTQARTVEVEGGIEEGFFITLRPIQFDVLIGADVVPALTFQAGAGLAF